MGWLHCDGGKGEKWIKGVAVQCCEECDREGYAIIILCVTRVSDGYVIDDVRCMGRVADQFIVGWTSVPRSDEQ